MRLIGEAGCICCWEYAELGTACEVHHLTSGGHHGQVRRGHAYTVGLCGWHHRGAIDLDWIPRHARRRISLESLAEEFGPSYALEPNEFRRTFGGDPTLLILQSHALARVARTYVIHPGRYADPARPSGFAP